MVNYHIYEMGRWKKIFRRDIFENGQIQRSYGISQLEDGSNVITGNWKQYNAQGILINDANYNEKGKQRW